VFFESGDLLGLGHGGEVRWRRSLVRDYGAFKNHHGLASSLAQTDAAVLVLLDHAGPSYLLAVSKRTGEDVWVANRASRTSWTSPVVTMRGGRPVVVVSGGGALTAYDGATGKQLWTLDGLVGNAIPSPTAAGDTVVVGAGESRSNPDLVASARSNCCLRLTSSEGRRGYEVLWQGKKATCHHASPVIVKDHVYFVTKAGVVYCLDRKTGAECYAERLDNPCWATPVAAGDHIYFFGKDGITTVLKAGPQYVKLASNRLWSDEGAQEKRAQDAKKPENQLPKRPETPEQPGYQSLGEVVYGVAAVDNAFFLRTGTALYCLRSSPPR
jgi:outer membrane protein assembly factor BamB